jgi:MFS family permease
MVFLFVSVEAAFSSLLICFFAHEDASTRRVNEGESEPTRSWVQALKQTVADVRETWSNRSVRAIAVLVLCLQFGLGATNPLLELHVRDIVGPEAPGRWFAFLARLPGMSDGSVAGQLAFATSLLFGGMALVNLVFMPFWGRLGDRIGHRTAMLVAAVANIVALLVQAIATHYGLLLFGRLLMGLALAGTGPLAFGVAAGGTSVDRRGGAFGVVFSARTLSIAIGGTLGGALAGWIGIRGLMLGSAALVALALLMMRLARERPAGA